MNSFKKAISSFAAVTTIVWSMGGALLFPGIAQAATLSPGDLIKASGPAVYYYGSDGKRYVFPNEKTYFSWYGDFSSVKTITDAELAAIMIGGNVVIRPGTKLVKITTDPKTYSVSDACGMLHWITSEAIAKSLYGDSWATRVVDVPDAFFTDYQVGSAITTAVHPDGQLVKYSGDSNTYVVVGGQKRKLTTSGISANHLNVANAIETTITYSNGSDVTGYEASLGKIACEGQAVASIGNVTATLASDTPAGMTVPNNAASVQLAKFNLATDSNSAVVTGISIHRVGVGAAGDFSNIYLYDGNGNRLTTGRTINSSSNTIQFNGLNLTIPANSSQSIVVVGDLSTPSATGGQHAFEISDAASIVISGTGTVGGNFPVRGNSFTVGTTSAGTLNVYKGTTPADVTIGAQDVEISNFKLAASLHDIRVNRIAVLVEGDVTASDLTNFKLYQGSTVVASAASVVNGRVTLSFDPAYVITSGVTKVFSLHATVAGRSGRTIKTYVEYSTDVNATDVLYNTGAAVNIDPDAGSGTTGFDGGTSQYIEISTTGGQLTLAFNGPATGNIAKGSQDAKLYKFAITTADNAVTIRKLRFRLELSDGSNGRLGDGSTPFFSDVKVSDADTGAVVMGPVSLTSTITASGTAFLLTDSFDIAANTTKNFVISADLANSTDATFINKQYKVCLSKTTGNLTGNTSLCTTDIFELGDIKIVDTGENLALDKIVPNSAIVGNGQTVRSSGLTVDLAASPSAGTAVKKQADIPTVGIALTAGTESKIKVNSLKLTGAGGKGTAGTPAFALADLIDVVTSCSLWDGTTQIGTSKSPDATAGTLNFTNLGMNIDAGTTKTLTVKCTADSVIDGAADYFAVGIASADDVSAEDADSNTVSPSLTAGLIANAGTSPSLKQTVNNGGVLSIAAGSNPATTIVVGGSAVKFAEFTATAQNESITVDRITVTSTADAANFTSISVRQAGATSDAGSAVLPSGENSSKDISLTTPITVNQDQSVTFELWGTLAAVKSSSSVSGATVGVSRSGDSATLGLAYNYQTNPWDANYANVYNVHGIGAASGDTVYAAASANLNGNAMVIRKSKPVISRLAVSNTTLTTGTDTELYKFQIAPDAAGPIRWKQLEFTVATSAAGASMTLNNFKLYKGSTPLAATDVQILDALDGRDITGSNDLGSNRVVVVLTTEEVVSGSGTQYTLRATPSFGSATAASISTSFYRSTTATTGYLMGDATGTATAFGVLGIDTGTAGIPDGTVDVAGGFLWSDVSEPLHSYSTSTASTSIDWTNDKYVENMTETQTLSK